ncbi:MAG: MFS transporter [Erysipelotrichaceae bacterium]|nr:MFS transporter [Erysipelotrichaceae bacterium]
MIFTIIVLILIQFIITIEMSMVMPLAPIIASSYNINPSYISILNLGYALSGFLSPFFGYKADKFGIKKMIILSMLLFSIGCFITSFKNMYMYILGRFILGIGYFNLISLVTTYTTKIVSEKKLGFVSGIYKIAFSLGAFFAPLLTLQVTKLYSFNLIYLFLAGIGIFISILTYNFKDVTNSGELISVEEVKSLLKDKVAILYMLANISLSIPAVYFYNFTSVYLSDTGYSQAYISNIYSYTAFGSIIGGLIITFFSTKIGMKKLSLISTFFAGISLLAFITTKQWLYMGLMFGICYDTIWGLFYPVGSTFYENKVATFLTILSCVTSLTNSFSNLTGPIIYSRFGYSYLIFICAIGMFVCTLLMKWSFTIIKRKN